MTRQLSIPFVLVAVLSASEAGAQSWEVFDMTNAGLPSNEVKAITEDGSGALWVGTGYGLCKYDGTAWEVMQTSNSGLPGDVVNCLAVDTADRLWVGTQLNGIGVYDGAGWVYYDADNSPLPDQEIKSLTIDHRNWVWIGTYVGAVCFTGSEWRIYSTADTSYGGLLLHGNVIEDIQVRSDGLVAIGTQNGGFHYLTDTSVTFLTTYDDNFPDNTQNAILFDEANNERWLATPAQGLLRQGGEWWNGPWFQYSTATSTISSNAITCLTWGSDEELWFGTLVAGLGRRYANGSFGSYTSSNSELPDDAVNTVFRASDGSLWAGTAYGGVARLTFSSGSNEKVADEVTVFPVPTSGPLTINLGQSVDPISWMLFDQRGARVGHGSLRDRVNHLDISGMVPGLYVLSIMHGTGHTSKCIQLLP